MPNHIVAQRKRQIRSGLPNIHQESIAEQATVNTVRVRLTVAGRTATMPGMSIKRIGHAYVADTARVLGEVDLAHDVSIWYGVSIRGDVAAVSIDEGTNVQDNSVIHCDHNFPNRIGKHVTIGHSAVVHGGSIGDGSLVGIHATVLGHVKIGKRCLVAAGAVVPPGLEVPDDMVVMGVPGRIVRETNEKEKKYLAWLAPHYVQLAKLHCDHGDDPRVRPFRR